MGRFGSAPAAALALLGACGGDTIDTSGATGATASGAPTSSTAESTEGNGSSSAGVDAGPGGSSSTSGDAGGTRTGSTGSGSGPDASASSGGSSGQAGGGLESAREVAAHLGRDHFLIGLGNDLNLDHTMDGAYTLGVTLDLHYAYLVGLKDQGGWTDWNANGSFVTLLADVAHERGVVPMYTLYSMAAWGEANAAAAADPNYMQPYWDGAKMLFERLGEFDEPAVVHFEPDWWAYAQQHSADPSAMTVAVADQAADCADLPDTMVGMGQCLVRLARTYAPKTLIGFHASVWAAPDPEAIAAYLSAIGGDEADLVFTDMLDRDAGCFEAGVDPACQRGGGDWYWDETNQTSPNFHEHLEWAKALVDGVGRPMMWWQVPLGVPSDTPGGMPGRYRDNRVKYIFENIDEFVEAGGVGACFGVGAENQTSIETDGGQFREAVHAYYDDPYRL